MGHGSFLHKQCETFDELTQQTTCIWNCKWLLNAPRARKYFFLRFLYKSYSDENLFFESFFRKKIKATFNDLKFFRQRRKILILNVVFSMKKLINTYIAYFHVEYASFIAVTMSEWWEILVFTPIVFCIDFFKHKTFFFEKWTTPSFQLKPFLWSEWILGWPKFSKS